MRVIAGRLKGRNLVSFKGAHIRPTTDRVKETLFNILQRDIPGARILDLFSGTGNLGIEAWSRDASEVVAVENHRGSLAIIRKNLEQLKIDQGFHVVAQDVFQFLKAYKGAPFAVIFFDPPFTESLADDCLQAVAKSKVAVEGTLVVIEAHRHEKLQDRYESFVLLDRRDFGDKYACIFKKVSDHE